MPKAVMVSHDNIIFESTNAIRMLADYCGNGKDVNGKTDYEERILSYLPLSHVAGMMVDIICPVAMTADEACGGKCYTTVSFARPYDLKLGTISMRLKEVQPTMFLG